MSRWESITEKLNEWERRDIRCGKTGETESVMFEEFFGKHFSKKDSLTKLTWIACSTFNLGEFFFKNIDTILGEALEKYSDGIPEETLYILECYFRYNASREISWIALNFVEIMLGRTLEEGAELEAERSKGVSGKLGDYYKFYYPERKDLHKAREVMGDDKKILSDELWGKIVPYRAIPRSEAVALLKELTEAHVKTFFPKLPKRIMAEGRMIKRSLESDRKKEKGVS